MKRSVTYSVIVSKYPEGEDIMFGLSFSKIFDSLPLAIKCKNIWKDQFNLDSHIYQIVKDEVE